MGALNRYSPGDSRVHTWRTEDVSKGTSHGTSGGGSLPDEVGFVIAIALGCVLFMMIVVLGFSVLG